MIPDRIGIIGSTQGVKESSTPMPKNVASSTARFPSRMSPASRSCSDTYPAALLPGEAVAPPAAAGEMGDAWAAAAPSLGALGVPAAPLPLKLTFKFFVIGG